MSLPLAWPIKPMLAKSAPAIPSGRWYEPKWDGFRALIFADGPDIVIGSRGQKPLTHYFPEVVAALAEQLPMPCVLDGEIVCTSDDGSRIDFERLQARIHPAASRIARLSAETPATFVAFDLLALGEVDLTARPFRERRALLEELAGVFTTPLQLTPLTTDVATAQQWFEALEGAGLDGVMAKDPEGTYQPDKRVMAKIKHVRTTDCVVAGLREHRSDPGTVGSLLLGMYADDGSLHPVGVIGAFSAARRAELYAELQPLICDLADHPWAHDGPGAVNRWNGGKDMSFTPLRPERVVEVKYDFMEGDRFRHTAQFVRWRPDKDAAECRLADLDRPAPFDLGAFATRPQP